LGERESVTAVPAACALGRDQDEEEADVRDVDPWPAPPGPFSGPRRARPRSWASRLLTVAASAAIVGGMIVPAAAAVPGDLTYAGCYGDLAGCTPAYPPLLKWGDWVQGLAVNGLDVYTISPDEIKHFTRDSAGNLSWADCYASVPRCRPSPPGGGYAATVNAAGTWLYTAAASSPGTGAVARYKIGPGGALTFEGCNGRLLTATCAPTGPPGAVDGASSVAVTSDGTQLYVAAQLGNAISHFTVDKGAT
jgi:DNA-binding beta-propeller fold protein YncE